VKQLRYAKEKAFRRILCGASGWGSTMVPGHFRYNYRFPSIPEKACASHPEGPFFFLCKEDGLREAAAAAADNPPIKVLFLRR